MDAVQADGPGRRISPTTCTDKWPTTCTDQWPAGIDLGRYQRPPGDRNDVPMKDPKTYDSLSAIVLILGAYQGIGPFVGKLIDATPVLSLPARLPSPAWWLAAIASIIVTVFLLWGLDVGKKRAERRAQD
ncbi:hypothetical protein ACGFNU_33700 [Spirillospora sp. NPDC048911]|uniref:hypothetical protein n=1 Tax=Spirillospora sp. NPDC048911 TaxID=3364527 RepID=UPI0037188595